MSTIKVNSIVPPNVGEGVSIDGLQMPTAGPLSNRSLIINGAMQVAQRGTSATGKTITGYYSADRFATVLSSLGTWTVSQEADAPAGFKYSLKHACTTADSSPAAGDYAIVYHRIETQNIAPQIGYGTSSAKDLTLSFWVKSNKTGSASCGLFYSKASIPTFQGSTLTYTINSANTWEYKTVTFSPNSESNASADNSTGMTVEWWMHSGSSFSGAASTGWDSDQSSRNSSNIGIGGAVNDYFQITGVQLEVGSKATPFEHESYGQTLQKCLRYFFKPDCDGGAKQKMMGISYGSSSYYMPVNFPVPMRVGPSVPVDSGGSWRARANNVDAVTSNWTTHGPATTTNQMLAMSGVGTIAAATPFWFETHSDSGCSLEFNAEL